jgi:hypothetical protein
MFSGTEKKCDTGGWEIKIGCDEEDEVIDIEIQNVQRELICRTMPGRMMCGIPCGRVAQETDPPYRCHCPR